MSTLVTGAAGFIGSHLTQALLAQGETVVGLDNLNDYYSPVRKRANLGEIGLSPRFHFVEGDLGDAHLVQQVLHQHAVTKVAHLAAMPGIGRSVREPLLYEEVNVRGTLTLLDAVKGLNLEKFVLASTSSVYGDTPKVPFVETDPTDRPLAPYPAAKKAGELYAYTYHHLYQMPVAVLRFFNVYGPRGRPDMTPWLFTQAIEAEKEFTLFDAGRPRRDWTYVGDVVAGVVAALAAPLAFEIFNVGRGEPVTMATFVTVLEGLVGKRARARDAPLPPTDLPVTFADTSKAARLLGYRPQVSLEEGLGRFWHWYQRRAL